MIGNILKAEGNTEKLKKEFFAQYIWKVVFVVCTCPIDVNFLKAEII